MNLCKILKSNKGALFGMDARIAMVIFASISLVMGYFAFNKVTTTKDSALLKELIGLSTAIQNYQTDMGTFYQFTIETSNGINDFNALHDISQVKTGFRQNWNGPYFSITNNNHLAYGTFSISYAQADRISVCTAISDCYVWISLTDIKEGMWIRINSFVDEAWGDSLETAGQDINLGKIQASGNTDPRTLFYKSVNRKR